jgi:hypothetical protein
MAVTDNAPLVAEAAPVVMQAAAELSGAPEITANHLAEAMGKFEQAFTGLVNGVAQIPQIKELPGYQGLTGETIPLGDAATSFAKAMGASVEDHTTAPIWEAKATQLSQLAEQIHTTPANVVGMLGLENLQGEPLEAALKARLFEIATQPEGMLSELSRAGQQASPTTLEAENFIKKKDDGVMTSDAAAVSDTAAQASSAAPATLPEALANYATILIQSLHPDSASITSDQIQEYIHSNGGTLKAALKDEKPRTEQDYVTLVNAAAQNFSAYTPEQKESFLADAGRVKMGVRNPIQNLNLEAAMGMMKSLISAPEPEMYNAQAVGCDHKTKVKLVVTDTHRAH